MIVLVTQSNACTNEIPPNPVGKRRRMFGPSIVFGRPIAPTGRTR
jgi:hypothetical protein